MRKNKFNWMLAAAVVCGLSLSVTSCSDDDDNTSEVQKEQEAQQKAAKFWNVVGQLVSVDDVTDEYEGKTFEPTYGIADPTNPAVRIVNTNDMKTAAQRFANLVDDDDINENTTTYTWNDPEIGSMTYTKGGDATNWATVDVNIKAVPGLQKIIYRVGGEGDNGKFSGKAYYRFGDVVSRQVEVKYDAKKNNDQRGTITEYWICVRPAFGPEGKEDSHWVCVNTVSDKNYKYYKASTGTEYWLPYSMGTDKENMQNFAELLWAICQPQAWFDNVFNHHTDGTLWGFTGVPFFTDFTGANLKYHNQYFWQNVQEGWKKANVAQLALNLSNFDALNNIVSDGVRLVYKGYSWWFATSWNCELWEAVYSNGTKDEELNMHHAEYNEKVERNMKGLKFDVREMGQMTPNYNAFFNGDGKIRWAIRHATGKELSANKTYDVKQPISGVTPVYRYYKDVYNMEDLSDAPETTEASQTTLKNVMEGFGSYMIGDVVADEQGSRWFCIAGSPASPLYPSMTDHKATFISFDNIATNGNVATNVLKEADLMTVASRMALLVGTMTAYTHADMKLTPDKLGAFGEHVNRYANVNFHKIFMDRDSVWRFQDYKSKNWYNSASVSNFFNLAYNDGQNNRQAIARVIVDVTQAGTDRTNCYTSDGKRIEMWQYRVYKHYEVYDPTRMEGPSAREASVGMTLWQSRWAMTTDKMYLDDVASQQMVNKYAAADKWVRLQQTVANSFVIPGAPRKQAEASTRPDDYLWKNGDFATRKTSIFNEPVLFLRVMFVEDNGGKTPNLVSTDGRRLHIVHMQDEQKFYAEMHQSTWAIAMREAADTYWLDNQHYNPCEGWPRE